MTTCDSCGHGLAPLVRVVHVRVSHGYVVQPEQPVLLDRTWGPDLVLCLDCFQLRTGMAGLLELARTRRGVQSL